MRRATALKKLEQANILLRASRKLIKQVEQAAEKAGKDDDMGNATCALDDFLLGSFEELEGEVDRTL